MQPRGTGSLLLTASVLLLVGGCAGTSQKADERYTDYLRDPNAQRVALQVCIPNRTEHFDTISVDVTDMPENPYLPEVHDMFVAARKTEGNGVHPFRSGDRIYQKLREWDAPPNSGRDFRQSYITYGAINGYHGGGAADMRLPIDLSDTTEKNQPVFYEFTNFRPEDIVAVHISLPMDLEKPGPERVFWFKLPKKLVTGSYTNWVPPISEEHRHSSGESYWFLMTHGKDLPISEVGANAPQMRFKLLTSKDYQLQLKTLVRARYAVQLERIEAGRPSIPAEGVLFEPESNSVIPACGG